MAHTRGLTLEGCEWSGVDAPQWFKWR